MFSCGNKVLDSTLQQLCMLNKCINFNKDYTFQHFGHLQGNAVYFIIKMQAEVHNHKNRMTNVDLLLIFMSVSSHSKQGTVSLGEKPAGQREIIEHLSKFTILGKIFDSY